MSYNIERFAITTFIKAQNWFGLDPFGLDGESFTVADGAGFMRLVPGVGAQRSVGSPGSNLHEYAGVLAITFFNGGGKDTAASRPTADTIIAALTGLKIDQTGKAVSAGATVVIDFARAGVPYIAASVPEAPFLRTVVNAPFIRSERT